MKKIVLPATFDGLAINLDDSELLAQFKNTLSKGQKLRVTFEHLPSKRSEEAFKLFHSLRDRYSSDQGVDRDKAKIDFKLAHGVVYPIDHDFHCKRHGQVVELPNGKFKFVVSTNEYSVQEMYTLVRGTIRECIEAQVDVEDLIQEWRVGTS